MTEKTLPPAGTEGSEGGSDGTPPVPAIVPPPATPDNVMLAAALAYAARGWAVFPCQPRGKAPRTRRGFRDATTFATEIRVWWRRRPSGNIGVATGAVSGLVVVDVDPRNGGAESLRALERQYGELPLTPLAHTGGGGQHLYFAHPEGAALRCGHLDGFPGIDLKADGGYVIAPPSIHPDTGRAYQWAAGAHPEGTPLAAVPGWLLAVARARRNGDKPAAALGERIPEGRRNAALTSLAGTMRRRGMSQTAIEAALLAENEARCHPPLDDDEVRGIARKMGRYEPAEVPRADGVQTFNLTDAGNGEWFAHLYGDRLRFDHLRRRWLVWADGKWWCEDADAEIHRLVKEAARERFKESADIADLELRRKAANWAVGSEARSRLDAALARARSEHPIADSGEGWDADPWLLGVANGVVDLRTGTLRPGRQGDRITIHTDVDYLAGARSPRWDKFLDEVFGGDDELLDFIGRAVGYSLSGATSEQCVFMCWGRGAKTGRASQGPRRRRRGQS